MKHLKIIFTFLLISFSITINAQTKKAVKIGFSVAPGFARLYGNDILQQNSRLIFGYAVGASLQLDVNQMFSIHTNLLYEKKGNVFPNLSVAQNGVVYNNVKIYSNFNYIALPVMLRAAMGKKRNFFIAAGPYLGYLLSHTLKTVGENINATSNESSSYKKVDVGLSFGFGANLPITKSKAFSVELRNNIGLKNISVPAVVNNGKIKTNSLNLIFAYNLNANKK